MDYKQTLITVLQLNRATAEEVADISGAYASGLITETEFLKKVLDLAARSKSLPAETLELMARDSFPYGVSAGRWDMDEESCKYCDNFASLRDAIIAWDEYKTMPWSRIEFTVDDFVYGLDPHKIMRKQTVLRDGKKAVVFSPCDANGHFVQRG